MVSIDVRPHAPWLVAVGFVALALGTLLVGYEPTGGDADALYRPVKSELSRALANGSLPFWSDRFGLGAPLTAESHAAAFYPPNWVVYRLLSVQAAYRLMMWLHYVALAASTFAYARVLGLTPWGASMSAISFALCGFQAGHSYHEPFYHVLPYLPLTLMFAERFMASGRLRWLGMLALSLGAQLTLGHFQIQMWTAALVVLTGMVRGWQFYRQDGHRTQACLRATGIGIGVGLAVAIALPQLGLTYELTHFSKFDRPLVYLTYYSFPLDQLIQIIVPGLFYAFTGGANSPHWKMESTTAEEACFYIGTIPFILAVIALNQRADRKLGMWKWVGLATILLATMPHWSLNAYMLILRIPGIGYFRAPGRYTLLTSFALCLFAGKGLDRTSTDRRFRSGLAVATLIGLAGLAWGWIWSSFPSVALYQREDIRLYFLRAASFSWCVAIVLLLLWKKRWAPEWLLCIALGCELAFLYYQGSTTWRSAIDFQSHSPILKALEKEQSLGLIAGDVQDLPIRAGLTTAFPNLGIVAPTPNYLLESSKDPKQISRGLENIYNRYGVTHGVFDGPKLFRSSKVMFYGEDEVFDALLPANPIASGPRTWRVERYPMPFPMARAAKVVRAVPDWSYLFPQLLMSQNPDEVWYLFDDRPPDSPGPRATETRVVEWSGNSGRVEHNGACDLVLRRTYFPGWSATINGGPSVPLRAAEGGLQSLRLPGQGLSRIETHYWPTGLTLYLTASLTALTFALGLVFGERLFRMRVENVAS